MWYIPCTTGAVYLLSRVYSILGLFSNSVPWYWSKCTEWFPKFVKHRSLSSPSATCFNGFPPCTGDTRRKRTGTSYLIRMGYTKQAWTDLCDKIEIQVKMVVYFVDPVTSDVLTLYSKEGKLTDRCMRRETMTIHYWYMLDQEKKKKTNTHRYPQLLLLFPPWDKVQTWVIHIVYQPICLPLSALDPVLSGTPSQCRKQHEPVKGI